MIRIYANLIGTWTDISEDGEIFNEDPITFYRESWQTIFDNDYVNVGFEGVNYRLHPSQLQAVTK